MSPCSALLHLGGRSRKVGCGSPRWLATMPDYSGGSWLCGPSRCGCGDRRRRAGRLIWRTARERGTRTMTIPVLMVVDDDPDSLGMLDRTLRRRYGQDYLIVGEASPEIGLDRLGELRAAGREVAVIMVASAMAEAPAAEFFANARSVAPAAKRV